MKPRDRLGSRAEPDCTEGGGTFVTNFNMTRAYFTRGICLWFKNKVKMSLSIYIMHENGGKFIRLMERKKDPIPC